MDRSSADYSTRVQSESPSAVSGRRSPLFIFAIALAPAPVVEAHAADLTCNRARTISAPTTCDDSTVQSGCVRTVDPLLIVPGNMAIESGGLVTHAKRLEAGLALDVTGTLNVQVGDLIDLSEIGLRAGPGGSAFGTAGETYDPGCATIIAGATDASNLGPGASQRLGWKEPDRDPCTRRWPPGTGREDPDI